MIFVAILAHQPLLLLYGYDLLSEAVQLNYVPNNFLLPPASERCIDYSFLTVTSKCTLSCWHALN